jgi:hypothetical protein
MAPKDGKKKPELEPKEGIKRRREPRSTDERTEHALEMAKRRINASTNMWFEKERKKVHEPLQDLDEEIEDDILVVTAREGRFLSFLDKYRIKDIHNLVPVLQDVNHPYCICIHLGLNHFWTRFGREATEQQRKDFEDTQKYFAGKLICVF